MGSLNAFVIVVAVISRFVRWRTKRKHNLFCHPSDTQENPSETQKFPSARRSSLDFMHELPASGMKQPAELENVRAQASGFNTPDDEEEVIYGEAQLATRKSAGLDYRISSSPKGKIYQHVDF